MAVVPEARFGRGRVPSRRRFFRLAAVAIAVVTGCGRARTQRRSGKTEVKGTVTLDGLPLGGAVITIVSVADPNRASGALVLADGSYHCDNAPAGAVIIGVENDSVRSAGAAIIGVENGSVRFARDKSLESLPRVPARYKDWKTSGLKAVLVEKQTTVVPLELSTKPAAR